MQLLKARSHRTRASARVDARRRPSARVNARQRPSARVGARRRPSARVDARQRASAICKLSNYDQNSLWTRTIKHFAYGSLCFPGPFKLFLPATKHMPATMTIPGYPFQCLLQTAYAGNRLMDFINWSASFSGDKPLKRRWIEKKLRWNEYGMAIK